MENNVPKDAPKKIDNCCTLKSNYTIDTSILKQYDQRNLIFNRIHNDASWKGYNKNTEKQGLRNITEKRRGYTRIDYALAEAAWTVHDVWTGAFNWNRFIRPGGSSLMGEKWYQDIYKVENLDVISRKLKKAAKFYGASLVGITELDRRWLFINKRNLTPLKLPNEIKSVIVMAFEMNELGIAASPTCLAAAATGLGYSMMAFTASCLSEFIRNLGYIAIPAGNDIALSIPLAIDAGLGQLGRNGLLITPEYGPRVRICKIFTNLPLVPDKPLTFGVNDFCRQCKLCAEACEVGAISMEENPSFQPACKSNNPGVLKWYVDAEKCYEFWCDNGTDCSTCIAVCPYNKRRKIPP
ncbi:MAG: reductive dehalogenase [Candidatus Bathyarchaeota archaeon]|nr:reductive dehalogenase [Candidatus Bathyarchaeota archaeon]